MVYPGKPSTGCKTCRSRKIKCDEGRPACSQCNRSKRTCPGYPEHFDLVLRDETRSTRQRARRQQQRSLKTPHPDIERLESQSSDELQKALNSWIVENFTEALPLLLEPSPSTIEDLAVCRFFSNFVLVPRHPEAFRGFLDGLPPLFSSAPSDSALSLSTTAVSLAIVGGGSNETRETILSRKVFGKALITAHRAIDDPAESLTDTTLLSVLMLSLYERLTATAAGSSMVVAHDAGAVALIKHRGKAINTSSEVAIILLRAVHAQVIDHAVDAGMGSGDDLAVCLRMLEDLPQNPSSRLTTIAGQLADLRRKAASVISSKASEADIFDLLDHATQVDHLLNGWALSVPEDWRFVATDQFELPKSAKIDDFVYRNRIDMYLDSFVVGLWNSYRATRIQVLCAICDSIDALPQPPNDWLQSRRRLATATLQKLADDICGTVPFYLGTKTRPGTDDDPRVEYPYKDKKFSKGLRRAQAGAGGYNLIEPYHEPLQRVLRLPSLRAGQNEWVFAQLGRIGRLYGLQS